jgi:four helix bundle protein
VASGQTVVNHKEHLTGKPVILEGGMMTQKIRSYEDLHIWKRAIALAKKIYEKTRKFPREELYGLSSQLRRAAVSVPSNMAEGQARQHTKEFIQFLYQALGSLAEMDTQLIIAKEIGFLIAEDLEALRAEITEIRKMTSTLIQKLV